MLIAVADLPSKGFRCNVAKININPITYKQISWYNDQLANTYIQKIYRDMELLRQDIGTESFDQLPFFDLDMLIFYKKFISVSEEKKLMMKVGHKCIHCGAESNYNINVDDLSYSGLEDVVTKMQAVEIGGVKYPVRFPTMKDASKVADTLLKYREDISRKTFLQLCIFDFDSSPNKIKAMIDNAIKSDILLLEYVYNLFEGACKEVKCTCNQCRKEDVIKVNNLMTDFLRLLRTNCRVDASKIILSKNV